MGQKVNPNIFRLGVLYTWDSSWYSNRLYTSKLHEDIKIRRFIFNRLNYACISKIFIERPSNKLILNIHSSKPGLVIGKKGIDISYIKKYISNIITSCSIIINITEIKKPESNASLISTYISSQIKKRISVKKIIRRSISSALKAGLKGIKIILSGRLAGCDIARIDSYKEGSVPLHTLRSVIHYSSTFSNTLYGVIGVKVWTFKGNSSYF